MSTVNNKWIARAQADGEASEGRRMSIMRRPITVEIPGESRKLRCIYCGGPTIPSLLYGWDVCVDNGCERPPLEYIILKVSVMEGNLYDGGSHCPKRVHTKDVTGYSNPDKEG